MPGTAAPTLQIPRRAVHRVRAFALDAVGGPARGRVVLTLAAVLGLAGADTGTISATTGNLERAFGVGNTQIGLLLSGGGPAQLGRADTLGNFSLCHLGSAVSQGDDAAGHDGQRHRLARQGQG